MIAYKVVYQLFSALVTNPLFKVEYKIGEAVYPKHPDWPLMAWIDPQSAINFMRADAPYGSRIYKCEVVQTTKPLILLALCTVEGLRDYDLEHRKTSYPIPAGAILCDAITILEQV